MKYRPEIDGLRTVAVLPVILFHAGFSVFSGGFVGVDVFFVISGYLITTILLQDMDAGTYSLLRFYERRARRILPALFVVMLVCIPFAWTFMLQTQLRDFFESLAATALFSSNFLFWSESGYFAAVAEEKPLLHTWSLAVEEQYYLLFPPLLWLAMRWSRNIALLLILAGGGLSLGAAIFADLDAEAKFFLTHVRVWELLVGSLCAWFMVYRSVPEQPVLGALGLVMILVSIFTMTHDTPYPMFAVPPVVGTAFVILFARSGTFAATILSARVMVGIGLISFSAYLWHQPLFAFARITSIGPPPVWLMGLLALASLGLAAVSWRYVEQPFRGSPARVLPTRSSVLAVSIAGIVGFFALGFYGHEQEGFPDRKVVRTLQEPMIDARYERFRTWDVLDGVTPARFDLAQFTGAPDTTRLLLLGDSHSKGLFNAFYQNPHLFPGLEVRRIAIDFACYAEPEDRDCIAEMMREAEALVSGATHVAFAARWHRPGRLPVLDTLPDWLKARGIPVVLIGMTAEYDREGPVIIADIARDIGFDGTGFPVERANAEFFAEQSAFARDTNAAMAELARERNLPFLDRRALICDDIAQLCTGVTPDGKAVTYDYGHWTLAGSAYFGQRIAEMDWLQLPEAPALQ